MTTKNQRQNAKVTAGTKATAETGPPASRKDDKVFGLCGLGERWWKEVGGEVFPGWVVGFDERDFFFAGEVLQVFLAGDGIVDVLESFEVDKTVNFVFCGEIVCRPFAVFVEATAEIVGDANVEGAGAAGEDVDVVLMVLGHR
jgi:hypothetical protein